MARSGAALEVPAGSVVGCAVVATLTSCVGSKLSLSWSFRLWGGAGRRAGPVLVGKVGEDTPPRFYLAEIAAPEAMGDLNGFRCDFKEYGERLVTAKDTSPRTPLETPPLALNSVCFIFLI